MDAALKTVAYLRVSTRSQDLANQKLAILEFSQKRRFPIDQFIESRISSRQSPLQRRIDEMLGTLEPGDRLLVSELSRLGRSLSQVIQIVETLVRRKIRFISFSKSPSSPVRASIPPDFALRLLAGLLRWYCEASLYALWGPLRSLCCVRRFAGPSFDW